ncbi:MAG TPA: hypothetical protein PK949_01395 [Dysgonamonadaceae bacterium]|nr:hypothetical protein [Dysgonamonadaceae bacterium]
MKTYLIIPFISFILAFMVNGQQICTIIPKSLTCEYLSNPTGLDVTQPRFNWTLNATDEKKFGQLQTAYRILVASSTNNLDKNIGDCWDSGWVKSDDMQLIRYEGKELQSDKDYFWNVIVKDETGNISAEAKLRLSARAFSIRKNGRPNGSEPLKYMIRTGVAIKCTILGSEKISI